MGVAVKQRRKGAGRDPVGILLQLRDACQRLRLHPGQCIGSEGRLADHFGQQPKARPKVGGQRRHGDRRPVKATRSLDFGAQPFLGFRKCLGVQPGRSFVEHPERKRLDAARRGVVGGVARVERQSELGHRHRGPLRIVDRDPVGQARVRDVREVERRQLTDLGNLPLRPRRGRRLVRRHLSVRLELGFDVGRALARLQPDR